MKFESDKQRKEFWDSMMASHTSAQFDAAVDSLGEDVARMLRMFYVSGHTLKEIEVIFQRSGMTVRRDLHRGIEKLYQYFQDNK